MLQCFARRQPRRRIDLQQRGDERTRGRADLQQWRVRRRRPSASIPGCLKSKCTTSRTREEDCLLTRGKSAEGAMFAMRTDVLEQGLMGRGVEGTESGARWGRWG